MRGLIGCVAAAVAVASSAAVAAGETPEVRKISSRTWSMAQSVRTTGELRAAPARVRVLVTTPTVEVVEVKGRAVGRSETNALGPPRLKPGCYDVWLSTTRLNVFGSVVMEAKTTIRNWCTDGRHITSQPTVQRSARGAWGWSACGWDDAYAGWLYKTERFGAGGDALFAYGNSCAGAAAQSHHEVEVRNDGTYDFNW